MRVWGYLTIGAVVLWGFACTPSFRTANPTTDSTLSSTEEDDLTADEDSSSDQNSSDGLLSVQAKSYQTCATTLDGKFKCWGQNAYGLLWPSGTNSNVPVELEGQSSFMGFSVGYMNGCVIQDDFELFCWGDNNSGQRGLGSGYPSNNFETTVAVAAGAAFQKVSVGKEFVCAIAGEDSAGPLYCWGKDDNAQLGEPMIAGWSESPVEVDVGTDYIAVSSGYFHSCGITDSGVLKCWGNNPFGQAGMGATNTPSTLDNGTAYSKVSVGHVFSCGITTAGALKCWGKNDEGQLGIGYTHASATSPQLTAESANTFSEVSVGSNHACAITTDGELMCWGDNERGENGTGSMAAYSAAPLPVDSGTSYSSVSCGGEYGYGGHCCAITTSDVLKCWGYNLYGQLGNGNNTTQTTPQVISLSD